MSDTIYLDSFAYYFKKYRYKANISTLKQFGDLMAAEGMYYDPSNYTRWQSGERVPNDRKVLLAMLRVFIQRNAIRTIDECNLLFSSSGQKNLSNDEVCSIELYKKSFKNILPTAIEDFVGREELLKEINWKLITYNIICISGTAGIGKSTFVVYLANLLQKTYQDGIFYFRADIQYIDTILIDIARYYGEDISTIKDLNERLKYILSIFKNRKAIIILDNIDNYKSIDFFINSLQGYCKFILVSQFTPPLYRDGYHISLSGFDDDETLLLANHKLGVSYVTKNNTEILKMAKLSGYSPLALDIMFSYIHNQQITAKELLNKIDNVMLPITYQSTYDNKTVASSIEISLSTLEKQEKNLIFSLSIFDGADISIDAIKSIHSLSEENLRQILTKLIELSLIERTKYNRIQVHPLIKAYLKQNTLSPKWYQQLIIYYLNSEKIIEDLDNIRGVFEYCIQHRLSDKAISLWNKVAVLNFTYGRWEEIKYYKEKLKPISENDSNPLVIIITIFTFFFTFGLVAMKYTNYLIYYSYSYCLVAFIGGVYALKTYKKWNNIKNDIGWALILFAAGLFAQVLGQLSYTTLLLMGSDLIPYPSIGDVGYFGSIPLYIYGTLLLSRAAGITIGLNSLKKKIQTVLVPTVILSISYFVFLRGYIFDFSQPLKIFLDFGYPLGQATYVSIAFLIFFQAKKTLGDVMKKGVLGIVLALFVQYVADFDFLFRYSRNLWQKPADIGDFIYLLAYAIMGIALLQFDYTRKLKDPNNPDLFTKVKKYIFSTT